MNSDAHTNGTVGQAVLRVPRRVDGVAGTGEHVEERVSLHVHLDAAVLRQRRTEDSSMFRQNVGVSVTEVIQQLRRALDVGEKESDCSGREFAHSSE